MAGYRTVLKDRTIGLQRIGLDKENIIIWKCQIQNQKMLVFDINPLFAYF